MDAIVIGAENSHPIKCLFRSIFGSADVLLSPSRPGGKPDNSSKASDGNYDARDRVSCDYSPITCDDSGWDLLQLALKGMGVAGCSIVEAISG
jgi:hypothetical protein